MSSPTANTATHPTEPTPTTLPTSPLFTIRQTPSSGRAVFATRPIPSGTLLHRSTDLTITVLLREYRREVCAQCFVYENGRDLSIRDSGVGFAFCSPACKEAWRKDMGDIGIQAWTAVEKLTKGRGKEDSEMVDVGLLRPGVDEIKTAWDAVEQEAGIIRAARAGERSRVNNDSVREGGGGTGPTKQHRRAIQKAQQAPISPDIMSFLLSGLLIHTTQPTSWPSILALATDTTPYHSTADLLSFTRSYLALLTILPIPLLPHLTPTTCLTLSSRDSHNSFGIRSLDDEGSEFFGYGCWPSASYFNHSCEPNLVKRRVGRVWEFCTRRDVQGEEELCISYLSGEERGLGHGKRVERLRANWGFVCGCVRCEGG